MVLMSEDKKRKVDRRKALERFGAAGIGALTGSVLVGRETVGSVAAYERDLKKQYETDDVAEVSTKDIYGEYEHRGNHSLTINEYEVIEEKGITTHIYGVNQCMLTEGSQKGDGVNDAEGNVNGLLDHAIGLDYRVYNGSEDDVTLTWMEGSDTGVWEPDIPSDSGFDVPGSEVDLEDGLNLAINVLSALVKSSAAGFAISSGGGLLKEMATSEYDPYISWEPFPNDSPVLGKTYDYGSPKEQASSFHYFYMEKPADADVYIDVLGATQQQTPTIRDDRYKTVQTLAEKTVSATF